MKSTKQPTALSELLFNDYRRKVLGLMLLRPDESYHVREIARLTGTVPGSLHRELSKLAEAGVLSQRKAGNQLYYQADRRCPIFEELASILRKTAGIAEVLMGLLAPVAGRIQLALVYGSVASGKATSGSDLDLLIVGDLKFAEAVKLLYPAQEILGREINPKIYSVEEWTSVKSQASPFIRELLTKPSIKLIGDKDDLR